jgi:hypothetical protein
MMSTARIPALCVTRWLSRTFHLMNSRRRNRTARRFIVTGRPPGLQRQAECGEGVSIDDFRAFMEMHTYIFTPSGAMWPASSVNSRIPPIPLVDKNGEPLLDDEGKQRKISAASWLDKHRPVLGGNQGVGKDTLLEPVKRAVGAWNFLEVSPQQTLESYNGFLKSVILRVNEARDLGDIDRFKFYDHMKAYTAAPPDVLRVNEKYLKPRLCLDCRSPDSGACLPS